MAFFIFRGEPFTASLISALSSAVAIFLSWALGRELDPAHEWSAFIALPVIYIAFFPAGRPSLLVLLFIILCCRLLNRTCGLQPLKSDALLLFVLAVLLYFNSFYFALPYLVLLFMIDALAKPVNRFQYISALVSSAAYLMMLIVYRPKLALFINQNIPVIYSATIVTLVVFSVIYVSYITRHDRVIDDSHKEELNYYRVNAARFLAAAWIVIEILYGGVIILPQVYPVVLIYGGILLYHIAALFRRQ